jgi:pyridoxal phosphate enzyme (YggS family)
VKYIIEFVSLIHSVDSFKLLKEINKQAKKVNRVVDCLLQFHIAEEQTKFGLSYEEGHALLESDAYKELENVRIVGLMGMATFTDDQKQVGKEFETLKSYFKTFQEDFFTDNKFFKEVSMGMSGDYDIALDKGSTLVRVGSLLFGARVYK